MVAYLLVHILLSTEVILAGSPPDGGAPYPAIKRISNPHGGVVAYSLVPILLCTEVIIAKACPALELLFKWCKGPPLRAEHPIPLLNESSILAVEWLCTC